MYSMWSLPNLNRLVDLILRGYYRMPSTKLRSWWPCPRSPSLLKKMAILTGCLRSNGPKLERMWSGLWVTTSWKSHANLFLIINSIYLLLLSSPTRKVLSTCVWNLFWWQMCSGTNSYRLQSVVAGSVMVVPLRWCQNLVTTISRNLRSQWKHGLLMAFPIRAPNHIRWDLAQEQYLVCWIIVSHFP